MSILRSNQSAIQFTHQRAAASAITATQAVRSTTSGQMQPAITSLRTIPFDGISLNSATTGQPVYVSARGPLDPTTFNLGDGYACAVGTTVAGFPVRAIDPTCASAPNWLGHCDAHGNITIAPRTEQVFIVEDFGLVADGVTPNDYLMEALRVVLNNSPCNVVQFGNGIYRFNGRPGKMAAIGGFTTDAFPFATQFQGRGVSDIFRPDPGPGIYSGKTGTVLEFHGPGVGLHIGYTPDANYGSNGAVRDMEIRGHLTTGNADYPNINEIGLQIVTDTSTTVERVRINGFKYGISLDGAETTWLHDISFDGAGGNLGYQDESTDLGNNSACGIRIGSFLCPIPGSANAIYIENVQFNNGIYGIWHSDGVSCAVSNCNYETRAWALIHSPINLAYRNCVGEGCDIAAFHGKFDAGPSASMFNLTIENCFFDGSCPAIRLENVSIGGLVFTGNNCSNFGSTEIIQQLGFAHIVEPVIQGGNALPGTGPSGFGLSSTASSNAGGGGTSINNIQSPQAALDVTPIDLSVPITRLHSGTHVFADEGHTAFNGGVHYKYQQVYNANTGRVGGYKSEYLECQNFADGYATHNLGQAVSPSQGGGRVTIEVEGVAEADRTKKGTWTIWQHWKDDGSGPSLVGSPTTVIGSTTDGAFVAPTIIISGGKFYAQVTEHPTRVTDWSALITVRHAGA